jgi:hypothetical protein
LGHVPNRIFLVDDGEKEGIVERLVWTVRWLAAEPNAALNVVDDPRIVPAEIANDLDTWLEVASEHGLVEGRAHDVLTQIDETFSLMSGEENAHHWTPEAVRSSREWAEQRERARTVLALLGQERADGDLRGRV